MTRTRRRHVCALLALAVALACWPVFGGGPAVAAELIMFESPGCPWCARWRAEVGPGYPRSPEGQRAPLRVHDLSRDRDAGVRLARPVTASPTFVLADNGVEVGRIVGYPGPDFFWGLLERLIAKLERPSADPQLPSPPGIKTIALP